jgi:hypothetical protein
VSNQSHLALVAEIRERPEGAEEKRVTAHEAPGREHVLPQRPTHAEAMMSIHELLDDAETRHVELEAQYLRARKLLDELVGVAYEEYMDRVRAYPSDPSGDESTKVSRWLEDHRSLLPPDTVFPRRSSEFNGGSDSPAHREWRARVLGAVALGAALCALARVSRRLADA